MTLDPVEPAELASSTFDVAIVGGGAAGLLVAVQLLRAGADDLRVIIVEPRPRLGEGVAYSTRHPEHLLNVIASRMSAFDDDAKHFVRFLLADPPRDGAVNEVDVARTFAPRRDFARYLRACLQEQATAGRLTWVREEVIDLQRNNGFTLRLKGGSALSSRQVVLAIGNLPRALPLSGAVADASTASTSAWDYDGIHAIAADADVCIVGSGLSMVDAVMSLEASGHRGRITVLSRHGLMPLSHAAPGGHGTDIAELLSLPLSRRMRWLRRHAKQAGSEGRPWQWTMDSIRPYTQALWQSLDTDAQRRFLRHASRYWDIHRHRIAPAAAATLAALRNEGRLTIHAAREWTLAGDEAGRRSVTFFDRHSGERHDLRIDHLLNATGVESNLHRSTHSLIQSLLARGTIQPGRHGIGMDTDESGRVASESDGDIHTLGAPRIGELWESIAIPELRKQAEAIARRIAEELRVKMA